MDDIDRRLIDVLQEGLPLCEAPYAAVAETLGLDEADVRARLQRLLDALVLTRFGPLFNADRMGGANVLAAMAVPEADFERIAQIVNRQPEVAHNYRREHRFNLWFVAAAETPEKAEAALRRIEADTGHTVYRFPKEREFCIRLRLKA